MTNNRKKTNSKIETQKSKLRIVFMGSPEIAAQILAIILKSGFIIDAVITQPDRPCGRSCEPMPTPVKSLALEHNIKIHQPSNKEELSEIIKITRPDLCIVAAYGIIIPKEALDIPKLGMINFHPSLLPLYRGPSPITAPILNGDSKTGVSIIKISEEMDAGDIILQREIDLNGTEKTPELSQELAQLGATMITEIIPKIKNKTINPIKQNDKEATYTKIIKKEDGKIDWQNQTASDIEKMSRAFYPWPGAYSFWKGKKIDLYDIAITQKQNITKKENIKPGEVITINNQIFIGAKKGLVLPQRIKIEGKKTQNIDEFICGYPEFKKTKL